MKDYSAMSDSEINNYVYLTKGIGHPMDENEVKAMQLYFNPCNNPADAWPIILENKISINHWCTGEWTADAIDGDFVFSDTPLRAAMIVYLQMMEQKS